MDLKSIFQDINIKYLVIASSIFTFFPVTVVEYNFEASIFWPFLIGYKSNSRIQGPFLGNIVTLNFFVASLFGKLGDLGRSISRVPLTL